MSKDKKKMSPSRKAKTRLTIKQIRDSGWRPFEAEQGIAWFGGKSHDRLAEYLPGKVLEDENFEDIDFLVVGWRK